LKLLNKLIPKIDESNSSDGEETNESESGDDDDDELQQAQPPRASRSATAYMVRQGSPSAEFIHDWIKDYADNGDVECGQCGSS
jgi:hypothetical protein